MSVEISISEPKPFADGLFSTISIQTPSLMFEKRVEVRGVRQNMPYPQEVQAVAVLTIFEKAEQLGIDLGFSEQQKNEWRRSGLQPAA